VNDVLLVGESIELHFAGTISSGQYEATVDVTNQVIESREDNNTFSFQAPTPTPPPLCVVTVTATP
jgi:subtilase family serine protease